MESNNIKRIAIWGYSSGYGGIECLVYNLYKNIDRKKIQFDFLTSHNHGKIAFEDEIIAMGGRVFRILYSQRESLIKYRKCWLDYFKEHPEVVGIHVNANFEYAFPLAMAKKAGIPLRILHSHNSFAKYGFNKIVAKVRKCKVRREIMRTPTKYLACSDMAADFMFPGKPYTLLKNGINVDKFDYNQFIREKLRKQYHISENDVVFGMVGRLVDTKNPLFAIDIFREYIKMDPNAKFVFAGEGKLCEDMKRMINKYGITQNVIFLGKIQNSNEWYQAMDILLFPSKFEGLGIVLIEAQTSGLPCLASDRVPKDAGITGLVEYLSLETPMHIWAKKADELIKIHKKKRKSYKLQVVNAGYDIKQVAKQLEEIYLS